MPRVRIPTPLRSLTDGKNSVEIDATNVADLVEKLNATHPGFSERILDDEGELRRFVNIYVGRRGHPLPATASPPKSARAMRCPSFPPWPAANREGPHAAPTIWSGRWRQVDRSRSGVRRQGLAVVKAFVARVPVLNGVFTKTPAEEGVFALEL